MVEAFFFQRKPQFLQRRQQSGDVVINHLLTALSLDIRGRAGFEEMENVSAWVIWCDNLPVDQTHILQFSSGLVVAVENVVVPDVTMADQRQRPDFRYVFRSVEFIQPFYLFLQPIGSLFSRILLSFIHSVDYWRMKWALLQAIRYLCRLSWQFLSTIYQWCMGTLMESLDTLKIIFFKQINICSEETLNALKIWEEWYLFVSEVSDHLDVQWYFGGEDRDDNFFEIVRVKYVIDCWW